MRKISLIVAISLSLFACGKQEKAANPFGKTGNKSTDPKMSEREFKEDCARKSGYLRGADESICYHVPHKFVLDEEAKKELAQKGTIRRQLGVVPQGSLLLAEVKGGQTVFFDLNGSYFREMTNTSLRLALPAGELHIRVSAGQYEYLSAHVAECFTRAGAVACPTN
jgi:hypothetical protein